jgi:hypothetical protein
MYVQLNKSSKEGKKYTAIFYDNDKKKVRTIHFGAEGSSTYLNHKNDDIKHAWIARHKVRGDFNDYMSASSLSYHLLWNKTSLSASFSSYLRKFNLKKY